MADARLRRSLLAFAASLALIGLPVDAASAGPESDIPGIPLPGPVATGQLGGPIYDVVYRFQTLPGFVVVASLSGTSGTDFDLYLFDGTATTVQGTQGLLAKSTGPTSTEKLSYPIRQGGTYYIDLNGASDVEGTYVLTVQIVPDQTPPTASMVLNGGRPATNDAQVSVDLTGYDALSGIAEMSFSPDGIAYTPWQPFAASSTWTFTPGDGPRTLWARVRDGAGNASAPTTASVTIDTVPPTILSLSPPKDSTITTTSPVFAVGFDEAINPDSWATDGLIIQAPDGSRVTGISSTDTTYRVGYFTPSDLLLPGVTYLLTIGPVKDAAGNPLGQVDSWWNVVQVSTSLTLSAAPTVLALGGGTALTGTATNLGGTTVSIEARLGDGTPYGLIGTAVPKNGKFGLTALPSMNSWYRATYPGGPGQDAATSNEVRVLVRRGVSIVGYSPAVTARARVGRATLLVAQLTPVAAGVPITFKLYRYVPARRAYVFVTSRSARSTTYGQVRTTWIPTSVGSYYWRVVVGSTPEYANNISLPYSWTVTR